MVVVMLMICWLGGLGGMLALRGRDHFLSMLMMRREDPINDHWSDVGTSCCLLVDVGIGSVFL